MNFCGHGTIATIVALKTKGLLEDKEDVKHRNESWNITNKD